MTGAGRITYSRVRANIGQGHCHEDPYLSFENCFNKEKRVFAMIMHFIIT